MIIIGLALLVLGLVWAAASPGVPAWVPWLGPMPVVAVTVAAVRSDLASRTGDRQTELLVVVGLVYFLVTVLAVACGFAVRKRRER